MRVNCRNHHFKNVSSMILIRLRFAGKTLSVLALSRVSPPPPRWRAAAHERRGGTLVVVPKSLLAQWEAQALQHLGEVHSRGGVLVFYGKAVKHISIKQLCEAEFVLTTYDAMRTNAGARKSAKTGASPAAAAAGGRGGGGKAAGGAAGARKRARAGSDDDDENDDLPLASDESDTDDEGAAARAQRLPSDDGDGDVIVLGSDTEDAEEGCGGGGGGGGGAGAGSDDSSSSDEDGGEYDTEPHKGAILSSLVFHRIVLDECHIIRNPNAQQSMAAFNLHATHRLALSGTPIQNKLEDLFTILRWLRVPAYKLDAPNTAEGSLEARTAWRRQISGPIGCSRNKQGQALAFARLNSLLDDLLIRRTKARCSGGVHKKLSERCSFSRRRQKPQSRPGRRHPRSQAHQPGAHSVRRPGGGGAVSNSLKRILFRALLTSANSHSRRSSRLKNRRSTTFFGQTPLTSSTATCGRATPSKTTCRSSSSCCARGRPACTHLVRASAHQHLIPSFISITQLTRCSSNLSAQSSCWPATNARAARISSARAPTTTRLRAATCSSRRAGTSFAPSASRRDSRAPARRCPPSPARRRAATRGSRETSWWTRMSSLWSSGRRGWATGWGRRRAASSAPQRHAGASARCAMC